ncbi:acyl-CoA thioesterase [Limosilactobacillus frumenti]|uniref:acyl-CoA thioesterase n=1 Tax=Limosilactobacillus frumenti TaxID=104955 RepID=UPI00070A48FD|nr:acyl-CoA thioesterase [Limosilactobacillus frumenti]QFG72914.1 acyl-CoA thioesterase [Limosilactobacillus frumenti]
MDIKCNQTLAVSLHRVFNADLNEHGTVFGGRILELVDGEASVAAMRITHSTVVTAAMDHVQFLKPFKLQDSMCMEAYVTGVGHRSLEVFVKVIGEHLMTGERFVGFTCFMTYVIQDPNTEIKFDRVIPENGEQKAMVAGYETRRQHRKANRGKQEQIINAISTHKPW